jgi:fatty-acyl-CoA synthase
MIMGGTLAGGGCLVLQEHFDPAEALRLFESERVTAAHAWPHQLGELEDHPDWAGTDLSSLRHVEAFSSLGRHPTVKVADVWSPRQAFGLTETFTIISSDPADTPRTGEELHSGHILAGNAIRILDPETGLSGLVGAVGEIAVKGPTLMKGYVKTLDPLDEEGFFHTGDAGFVDEDGQLHWTGRTSDLIKTGGANVSPVEIETALLHHPALKAAHAVGVADPLLGELVVVCAVAHEGAEVDEQNVREFLRRRISAYKIPRRVLFVQESELSFTGNAKIRTVGLRTLAGQRLGSSDGSH